LAEIQPVWKKSAKIGDAFGHNKITAQKTAEAKISALKLLWVSFLAYQEFSRQRPDQIKIFRLKTL
jgi:hypothetical protein